MLLIMKTKYQEILKKDGYLAMVNQIMIDMSDIGVARDKGYGNDR